MNLQTLTAEDIIGIHERLIQDFAATGDPISPPGLRSLHLLESAVFRQHTGSGSTPKYATAIDNAATLTYGICCNHPFHNGNKRTALVSLLVHLDRNKLSLFEVGQKELFEMIIDVADHTIGLKKRPKEAGHRRDPDEEVKAIAAWIKAHADKITRGEKPITFKQLGRILQGFDYHFGRAHDNSIDIVRYEIEKRLFRGDRTVEKHITTIAYPRDGVEVPLKILKHVRRVCKLTEEDGVDSAAFYDDLIVLDAFINRYRTILRRLAIR